MEPLPPAGSPHRGGMSPSLLGPSSCSAFPAAAYGNHEAAVSEHACVTLDEWWLAPVEGDEQKIAVAGTFKRNQTIQEYSPGAIAKRHTSSVLETVDGTILRIHGSHNISQTYRNGYSTTVCEKFLNGFPLWWQSCKLLYPKLTNTHTECQPCSSNASNSGVDSTQFYLEKFEQGRRLHLEGIYLISKYHDILGSFSQNDAAFQKSSHLLNGTPRFEEYTCDGDIAINENAAASCEAATGDQKTPVVSVEVRGCRKETQHMSLTKKAAVDDEMPTSVYLDMQKSFCLSNGTPILEEYTCNGDIPMNEDAAASNDDNERYTATSKEVNNMEIGLVTCSPSRERGHDDIGTDVSLAPAVECTNNAISESVHSTPATGTDCKKTPLSSLKSQGSWRENQHTASNKKPVDRPQKQISPQEKCQSATRFPLTRNSVSYAHRAPPTRGKDTSWSMTTVEALNLKRSRSGRSGDDEGGEDAVARRRRPHVAVRKVSMNKGGQPSSSRGRSNIGVRKSPLKKVPKTKLQGNENGATEHFKTRFSVHRILKLVPGLDKDRKDWIALSGHGSLLSMSKFSIPVKLVKWIMQHIDPLLCEFRLDGKVIIFDRPLVCKILGFENGTKPLDLSVDVGRVDEFMKIHDQYRDGDRAKLRRCIQVLTSSKDRDSFMRAFMLLASGTVYCPSTTNAVCMKYVHSLYDVSKIKEYDWAGHILEMLMEEVTKYQNLSPEQLERDHHIAGCLAILAIAYMDHLDIPKDRGTHQICYDVPRICNVSEKDFEFVMSVDMQRHKLHSYGRLPFRAVTPYSTPPSTTEHPMADEVHVHSSAASLDDWLHPSGSSNQSAQQVPPEYQPVIAETNSLIERDIDKLVEAMAADFKVKRKGIYRNRLGEMTTKLINLTHQGTCTTRNATKASTSGGVPPSKVCDGTAGQRENNLAQTGRDVADIEITEKIASIVIDTVKSGARLDSSNTHSSPSSPRNIESPTYCSDIPPFDLFNEGDADFYFIYGDDMVGTKTGSESKTDQRKKRKIE